MKAFTNNTHLAPLPDTVSERAADVVYKLLTVDVAKRLCCSTGSSNIGGISPLAGTKESHSMRALQTHPWFEALDFERVAKLKVPAPLGPLIPELPGGNVPETANPQSATPQQGPRDLSSTSLEARFVEFMDDEAGHDTAVSCLLCDRAASGDLDGLREVSQSQYACRGIEQSSVT